MRRIRRRTAQQRDPTAGRTRADATTQQRTNDQQTPNGNGRHGQRRRTNARRRRTPNGTQMTRTGNESRTDSRRPEWTNNGRQMNDPERRRNAPAPARRAANATGDGQTAPATATTDQQMRRQTARQTAGKAAANDGEPARRQMATAKRRATAINGRHGQPGPKSSQARRPRQIIINAKCPARPPGPMRRMTNATMGNNERRSGNGGQAMVVRIMWKPGGDADGDQQCRLDANNGAK